MARFQISSRPAHAERQALRHYAKPSTDSCAVAGGLDNLSGTNSHLALITASTSRENILRRENPEAANAAHNELQKTWLRKAAQR